MIAGSPEAKIVDRNEQKIFKVRKTRKNLHIISASQPLQFHVRGSTKKSKFLI